MTRWDIAVHLGLICFALMIAIEDFSSRRIRILWLAGMTGLAMIPWSFFPGKELLDLGMSVAIVVILLGSCFLVLRWKQKDWDSIGAGDIWLMLILPLVAEPFPLLWLIVGSSWGLLAIMALSRVFGKKMNPDTIPLAGGLAIGLVGLLSWKLLNHGIT